ncbi:MAG: leucine-rich repeat protein [Acutalibacteraceae bacterium]
MSLRVLLSAGAFYNCFNLKSVIFEEGSNLKYVDDSVFQNCRNLETINLPDSVVYINSHCFWDCGKLPSTLVLPKSLEKVEPTAFYNTKLKTVALPEQCKYQKQDYGFPYAPSFSDACTIEGGTEFNFYSHLSVPLPPIDYTKGAIEEDESEPLPAEKFIVPEGTTKIESTQFIGRKDLVDIVIPKSVKVICPGAFYMCCNLKSVRFEEGSKLKAIEGYAFQKLS